MNVELCTETPSCWIIAYGNPHRSDDGIGAFVAGSLAQQLAGMASVGIVTAPQLDPILLEEIHAADHLIFVDACVAELHEGVRWSAAEPELNGWALGAHHIDPGTFLGLLDLLYDARPAAWVVSVQGRNFELGETLDPEARNNAERAAMQIMDWLFMHSIAIPCNHSKWNNIEKRG